MSACEERLTSQLYDRWADSYPPVPHNPLMRAEQEAMCALWPSMKDLRVLDLACGSGRYARLLARAGAATVIALDRSGRMLRQVTGAIAVQGTMARLPFARGSFDAVVCGLAVGHAQDLDAWMRGAAWVLAPGGALIYSDFHPQASAAGHVRRFSDSQGSEHSVPHHRHTAAAHARAAAAAGLAIDETREVRVGMEMREAFPGSAEFYRRWHGLPVAIALRARK